MFHRLATRVNTLRSGSALVVLGLCVAISFFVANNEVRAIGVGRFLQEDESEKPAAENETKKDTEAPQETDVSDEPEIDTKQPETAPVDPQNLKIELWEGIKITGKIQVDSIRIKTDFGTLDVPISRIEKIYPGLNSYPNIRKELDQLVDDLGNKDFDVREAAQRALANRGMMVQRVLLETGAKEELNAEQRKRLSELTKELENYREEMEYEGETLEERVLIEEDTIVTDQFAIVGKIELETFEFRTRFGNLKVALQDIKQGNRDVFAAPDTIKRMVSVKGDAFFQRSPVSTRIRVNKGDRISISASGTVNWTNWSRSSGAEGLTNMGQYQGITSGALTARIGNGGKLIKIGEKESFVAKTSGTLYLGVAMMDNYVNQNGYSWTGSFRTRVKVEPSRK